MRKTPESKPDREAQADLSGLDFSPFDLILDGQRFQQFLDFLDAPPKPNPGLERLLAVKAPWKA